MKTKKLWIGFILVIVISFGVLLYFGNEIYRKAPPVPKEVKTTEGKIIFSEADIKDGQNVWQSIGGQEFGTVWGHGAYQAPDWTADWLHKEAIFLLDSWSKETDKVEFSKLSDEKKAVLIIRLQKEIRKNTYDPETGILTINGERANAIESNCTFYAGLFMSDTSLQNLREAYSLPANTIKSTDMMRKLNAFFFWASWATVTNRPNDIITYTSNWPSEKLVGNEPVNTLLLWTGLSVIILLAGIGLMVWFYASKKHDSEETVIKIHPYLNSIITPSMKATAKYFWVVTALIFVQVVMGVITAHYGVEGLGFYGFPLADFLPYSISRTWHLQLAIFWIATSWLATGLYYAPAISNYEPRYQKLGVNFLFICLLIIVVGSLLGQWLGVMQKLGLVKNFWFGHQGLEYVDLGKFWQIFLFIGLILWLILLTRAILPGIKKKSENKNLLVMFLISTVAIALFYGAGLMWGRQTNLAITEYWRWWVVHLWVEGFFEVFASVIIAFLFVRLQLIKSTTATTAVLFSTTVFLSGGIIGTFHHLYFTGTPISILALGATFSALEVVPLVLVGFEAFENLKHSKANEWIKAYKWQIYTFIAVSFWNLVGAGIFGFLINPPIALYYMQGLNTTPVHSHTALFGVYGMLGIGLMLFVFRDMNIKQNWNERWLKISFLFMNIGLMLMVLLSMLPIGLLQTIACVDKGLWYARSADFLQQDHIVILKYLRIIGDTIFAVGAAALVWFIFGLKGGWSIKKIN
jgi:nitric oxide reductase subunit B